MTSPIHAAGDVLDNTKELVTAAISPAEAMMRDREDTSGFRELLQSLENDFLNDLIESRQKTDWSIAGGKLG